MKTRWFLLWALLLPLFVAGVFSESGFSAELGVFDKPGVFDKQERGAANHLMEDDLGDDFQDESMEGGVGEDDSFKDDSFTDDSFKDDLGDDFNDESFEESNGDSFTDELVKDDLGDDFQDEAGPSVSSGAPDPLPANPPAKEKSAKKWAPSLGIRGRLNLSSAVAISRSRPDAGETDWRGVSSIKQGVFLECEMDLFGSWTAKVTGDLFYDGIYAVNGRDRYLGDTLDQQELGGEIREAFVQGRLSKRLDIKVGRQIAVWGKSDYIRVTDVLNPINMREPGKIDLEDLRIPVLMSRIDYYFGKWNITGIAIHERRLNKEPVYGSMFYPYSAPPLPEKTASDRFSKTEWAASANGSFSGMDLSFYYADYYEKTPHLVMTAPSVFEKRHSATKMAGADFNLAKGSWLMKSEAAFFDGIRFSDRVSPSAGTLELSGKSYSKANILAGLEYSGFSDTTIAFETMNSHIIGFDDNLKAGGEKKNRLSTSIAATRSFLNDRFGASVLATIYGENGGDGALWRLKGEYEWTDSVSVSGGAVFYESGDLFFFKKIGGNDMLFLDVQYSF